MRIREAEDIPLNESTRRFLLCWRRGSFSLAAAVLLMALCISVPGNPATAPVGAVTAGITVWLDRKFRQSHELFDLVTLTASVAVAALAMYLATHTVPGSTSLLAVEILFALAAGAGFGRLILRVLEAELYFRQLYGKNAGRLQSLLQACAAVGSIFLGIMLGNYFATQESALPGEVTVLVLTIAVFGMFSKFRTVIPLEHSSTC